MIQKEQSEKEAILVSLIDQSKIVRASFGQGALFCQGPEDAALHAGPQEEFDARILIVIDTCETQVVKAMAEAAAEDSKPSVDSSSLLPLQNTGGLV